MKDFIKGMIFAGVGLTLVQCVSDLISSIDQYLCYKIAIPVYKMKQQIGADEQDEERNPIGFTSTQAIGFRTEDGQDYEKDDQ